MPWECTGCRKRKHYWPSTWRWFGSWKDLDDLGVEGIGITCGAPDCNAAAERKTTKRKASPDRATARSRKADRLRQSALEKLTQAERDALGLCSDAQEDEGLAPEQHGRDSALA